MPETNEQKARKWLDARYIPGRSADKTFFTISAYDLTKAIAPLFEAGPGGEATPKGQLGTCKTAHRVVGEWHPFNQSTCREWKPLK